MQPHVYFDLDGTMTDPFEGISKCILYAVEKLGFPAPSEQHLQSCIGPTLYDTFPEIVGDRKHDLLGAVANDIKPLGVSYGYGSVDELNNPGAAEIAHTTNDLGNIIARWLS
jgi:phosphoglycolate phosphatase-like HAD superfamily hydrolase